MLAKLWKKVLLAICIVACLYNVMSKIVNRNSLETNLKSVSDGNTIWDSVNSKNEISNTNRKIEVVKESSSNSISKNKVETFETVDHDETENEEEVEEDNYKEDDEDKLDENNKSNNKSSKYSDYFKIFKKSDE